MASVHGPRLGHGRARAMVELILRLGLRDGVMQCLLRLKRREPREATTTNEERVCDRGFPRLRPAAAATAHNAHEAKFIHLFNAVAIHGKDGPELDAAAAVRNGLDVSAVMRARSSRVPRLAASEACAIRHSNHRFATP